MRSLSAEEEQLWDRVTATIRPLSRSSEEAAVTAPQQPQQSLGAKPVLVRSDPPPTSSRAKIANTLDSTWDRRLRSGAVEPDRVIDLHGLSLNTAWRAIDRGLERAITTGDRVVLLITGHHRLGEPPVKRGKIRAAVHDWLAASRHADAIAAVRGAHRRHGGGGSLYLVLRRR